MTTMSAGEIEQTALREPGMAQRLRLGVGAQGFAQFVHLGIRLAEVPVFLACWSVDQYGEWLILATIPSYLTIADGGFTGATQREMTMRMGAGDRAGAISLFRSTWVLLLLVSLVVAGGVYAFTSLLPASAWLGTATIDASELRAVLLLLTGHVLLSFQSGLLYGGYACQGRYGRGTFLSSATHLLDFVGLVAALTLGGGPTAAALGLVTGRAVGLVVMRIDMAATAPWLRYGWRGASKGEITRLVRPSFASMALPLSNALNIQGSRLVVGLVLGPGAVVVFSALRTLARSALHAVEVVARLTEPEVALSYGAGKHDVVRMLFVRSSQIALWITLPASALLWFLGELILRVWTHGAVSMAPTVYGLLLGASAIRSLWLTALMIPYATNRHARLAVLLLSSDVGMLALSLTWMPDLGLTGAGAAVLAAELCMLVVVTRNALQLTGETLGNWLSGVVRPPVALVASMLGNTRSRP